MPLCDSEGEGVGFEPTVDETAHNGFEPAPERPEREQQLRGVSLL
jgi:hypothetical protein